MENQGDEAYHHYFYVDFERYPSVESVAGLGYFHVQWRREANTQGWAFEEGLDRKAIWKDPRIKNATGEENYVMLEAKGNGIYCGAHLDVDCFQRNPNDWYGEGDDMIFIDGEPWPPSLHGTGTEDWYHCAYCPRDEYNAPYHGIILYSGTAAWPWKGKNTMYRYHIEDPIRFKRSILVSIEHGLPVFVRTGPDGRQQSHSGDHHPAGRGVSPGFGRISHGSESRIYLTLPRT